MLVVDVDVVEVVVVSRHLMMKSFEVCFPNSVVLSNVGLSKSHSTSLKSDTQHSTLRSLLMKQK